MDVEDPGVTNAGSTNTAEKPGLTPGLKHVGNSLLTPFKLIKNGTVALTTTLKAFFERLLFTTETPASPTPPNNVGELNKLLANPDEFKMSPRNVINGITNQGETAGKNGRQIRDFLIANPDNPLFSSANIEMDGDKAKFIKPIIIPETNITIDLLQIDNRDRANGEFRGAAALDVLKNRQFGNLTELCAIVTDDPMLNFNKVINAKYIAGLMNSMRPAELQSLQEGKHADFLNTLVTYNSSAKAYEPAFTLTTLASPPRVADEGARTEPVVAPDMSPLALRRASYLNKTEPKDSPKAEIKTGALQGVQALRAQFEAAKEITQPKTK